MNVKPGIVMILAASILFIGLIVPYADSPLLYDVQSSARSSHHTNPEIFGPEMTIKSDSIFADMQYFLDANEQIIHYIRARDFIAAIHEYEQYDEKTQQFNTRITNIGLSRSDIGTFGDEIVQNREILFDIFIDSIRAEQLQNLEEMYEEQGEQEKADEIRDERRKTYESLSSKKAQLIGVYQSLATIAAHYQLNEEAHLESIRSYDTYLKQLHYSLTGEVQEETEITIPTPDGTPVEEPAIPDVLADIWGNRERIRIYFQLSPESGGYGDQIQVTGRLRGDNIAGRVINVYIDNQNWATATTSETGSFDVSAPVEKIAQGVHAVYCYSGISYSSIQLFTVDSSSSVLTLDLEREPLSNNFICRGLLSAQGAPVRSAPVELYVNNARKIILTTSEDGSYETVITIPAGENTVHTEFQGQLRGFPIDPSHSTPVSVTPGHNMTLVKVSLFLAGAFIILVVGVRLVFPRNAGRSRDGGDELGLRVQAHSGIPPEPSIAAPYISPGEAFEDFLVLAHSNDWVNAIHVLYLSLKETLIKKRLLQRRRSLTPREVTRTIEDSEKSNVLSAFMDGYEKIYYGRIIPESHEQEAIAISWKSFLKTLGDDDH